MIFSVLSGLTSTLGFRGTIFAALALAAAGAAGWNYMRVVSLRSDLSMVEQRYQAAQVNATAFQTVAEQRAAAADSLRGMLAGCREREVESLARYQRLWRIWQDASTVPAKPGEILDPQTSQAIAREVNAIWGAAQ